ncbi:MAG: hypothetical protein H6736_10475 [Alphaproteobacteria bacterium]|nr:hypothetical protein [Alphaproteobacteria bacterium]
MYRYLPTVLLILGVALLAWVGYRRASAPEPPAPDLPPGLTVEAGPGTLPDGREVPAPTARQRLVFFRPPALDAPAPAVVDAGSPPPPAPRELDLDDLPPERLEAVREAGLARLQEVVAACEDVVDGRAHAQAALELDDRGLVMLEVSGWEAGPQGELLQAAPPPPALAECLDDALWSGDWLHMEPGETLRFVLSMRFEEEG